VTFRRFNSVAFPFTMQSTSIAIPVPSSKPVAWANTVTTPTARSDAESTNEENYRAAYINLETTLSSVAWSDIVIGAQPMPYAPAQITLSANVRRLFSIGSAIATSTIIVCPSNPVSRMQI